MRILGASQEKKTAQGLLAGPFDEADLDAERFGTLRSRCAYPPDRAQDWQPLVSDIHALTVPPGEYPSQNLPSSIEAALLEALEQVPRAPSAPELPPAAYLRRTR
jgi:hypothetical protein